MKLTIKFLVIGFLALFVSACGVYTVTNGTAGVSQKKIDSLLEGKSTTSDVIDLFGAKPEYENRNSNGEVLVAFHTLRAIESITKTKFTKEERAQIDMNSKLLMWQYRKSIDSMLGPISKPINLVLLFDENGVLMRKFQYDVER